MNAPRFLQPHDLSVQHRLAWRPAAQLDQRCEIVGLHCENFLNELLKFFRCFLVALAFDLLGEFVDRDQVVLVQLD